VKENGDVFGIYTPAAWPTLGALAAALKGFIVVPDPTGRSFVFSLVNAARTPYQVNVCASALAAVGVFRRRGLLFGGDMNGVPPLVWLMHNNGGDASDTNVGHAASNQQRKCDGHEPRMTLPEGVLSIAGERLFTTELIEVYHLE
jgi:hypothetical protein